MSPEIPANGNQALPQDAPVSYSPLPDKGPIVPRMTNENRFSGAPQMPGTRRNVAPGEAPNVYTVQHGDTLFDVCDQLLDEPDYWPKLWSLNPEIKNPHFIYPGMRLAFYSGDANTPPFLEVITEDDLIPIDKDELKEEELIRQDISGVLTEMTDPPPTEIVSGDELAGTDLYGDLMVEGGLNFPDSFETLIPFFLFAEEPEIGGIVQSGTKGEQAGSDNIEILVEGEGLSAGNTYLIVRNIGEIYDKSEEYLGDRYDYIGAVNLTKDAGDGRFIGKLMNVRLGVQMGDVLIGYRTVKYRIPLNPQGTSGGGGGELLSFGAFHRELGGRGDFVLISKSASQSAGSTFAIFQNHSQLVINRDSDDLVEHGESVGHVYIVDTSSDGTVGYITWSKREARRGDTLGSNGLE